jgi:hypothetical protein
MDARSRSKGIRQNTAMFLYLTKAGRLLAFGAEASQTGARGLPPTNNEFEGCSIYIRRETGRSWCAWSRWYPRFAGGCLEGIAGVKQKVASVFEGNLVDNVAEVTDLHALRAQENGGRNPQSFPTSICPRTNGINLMASPAAFR